MAPCSSRSFSSQTTKTNKEQEKAPEQEKTSKQKAEDNVDEDKPFEHDPNKDKYNEHEEENQSKQFKTYRMVMFKLGKAIKYTIWACMITFFYHLFLVKKYEKPEEKLASGQFLDAARWLDWTIYDVKLLLTKPGMSKMLPDKLVIPGQVYPKTLVLNLNGTLVHQNYELGRGVTLYKRPGLSLFLQRLSRSYELCIFGMGESGGIQEACEALDPTMQMIVGRFGRESTLLTKDGKYVKDLSYLNRPIRDIVYVDFSDENVPFHKDNLIILPKFDGDKQDRALIDLIPFLEHLAQHKGDVRVEIKKHGRETCAEKFNTTQFQKLQFIQNQRNTMGGSLLSGLTKKKDPSKLQKIGIDTMDTNQFGFGKSNDQ